VRVLGRTLLIPLTFIAVQISLTIFIAHDVHIISEENFAQEVPIFVAETAKEYETIFLWNFGERNPQGTDYVKFIDYNGRIAFANGRIVGDGGVYDCFLLIEKIPFTKLYLYHAFGGVTNIGESTGFVNKELSFSRLTVMLDSENGVTNYEIRPNASALIGLALSCGVFFGQFRCEKRKQEEASAKQSDADRSEI